MKHVPALALVVAALAFALLALVTTTAARDPLPASAAGRGAMVVLAGLFVGCAVVLFTEASSRWRPP